MFFGYIDPGTGSLFLQAVLGVVLGSIVIFRNFFIGLYLKTRTVFARKKDNANDE